LSEQLDAALRQEGEDRRLGCAADPSKGSGLIEEG
jgi:hypothetical protein